MKVFYSDHFVLPLPPGHRFPMQKYQLLHEKLLRTEASLEFEEAPAATDGMLALAHDITYIQRVTEGHLTSQEQKMIGFPWSHKMVERSRRSTGATIAASRTALVQGISANLAGGTHHAYRNHGEGFCVFNDAAVAARLIQAQMNQARRQRGVYRDAKVMIIDLDVHQGNGTAAIFAHDDSVFTLSLHGERNYPFVKEKSDLDYALPDGTNDASYLVALSDALQKGFTSFTPDLLIYLAGVDPFEQDRLGRLSLTQAGLAQRDKMVFQHALEHAVPVAIAMAGGYGKQIHETVALHAQTITLASEYAPQLKARLESTHL